ncbi:MAG: hypothetical protein JWP00_699 [Chloroflexi bacterium]|jgi:uncharacterized protein YcsI (UPF0317 family)|nr:hypothetical protein [Chloroflexota bacterium]
MSLNTQQVELLSPDMARQLIRDGQWTGPTAQMAGGFAQANLVIIPQEYADDFREFCRQNSKACPLVDELEPGNYRPQVAQNADLRTDIPRYRLYKDGALVSEPLNLQDLWRDDLCSFLIGCSFTFDWALKEARLPARHQVVGSNVPMFRTNRPTQAVGPFQGPLVVSMRPYRPELIEHVVKVSEAYPNMHGGPVHIGNPAELGIMDITKPDYGDSVPFEPGELPVFWACGVTPQAVAIASRLPFAITHAPGHMFITDLSLSEALAR